MNRLSWISGSPRPSIGEWNLILMDFEDCNCRKRNMILRDKLKGIYDRILKLEDRDDELPPTHSLELEIDWLITGILLSLEKKGLVDDIVDEDVF